MNTIFIVKEWLNYDCNNLQETIDFLLSELALYVPAFTEAKIQIGDRDKAMVNQLFELANVDRGDSTYTPKAMIGPEGPKGHSYVCVSLSTDVYRYTSWGGQGPPGLGSLDSPVYQVKLEYSCDGVCKNFYNYFCFKGVKS